MNGKTNHCVYNINDLDKFKPINDILGHAAGDHVLATFGRVLMANLKGQDVAVRYGGDEFLLILPNTSPKGAERVVSNLRAAWERDAPDTGNLKVGFRQGLPQGKVMMICRRPSRLRIGRCTPRK
jgi:diguanylate cyclase (GGDEF)-like protein